MEKLDKEKINKELLLLPLRKDLETFEEYDKAYLEFQAANLSYLAQKYPNAFYKGEVYCGTHLPPEEIFKNGFPAIESDNFNLEDHERQFIEQKKEKKPSALRGSCEDARMPAKFAGEGYYVYKIFPYGGGIYLDTALGEKYINPLTGKRKGVLIPEEREIAIGSRQPTYQIEGYRKVGQWSWAAEAHRLGPFVKNPNFQIANIHEFDR